ncbi:right-handed parallel beta-helix repeat-containing protein [Nonomuraea sp. NN258]|uniref:right-handed parallel beta-helix repeat-containing protein n=1 Tax=Nonomuraea antri TaxID=2730852 RepID=UPI001568ED09|nr:right-handed parallel beta-helix repeat-containing protein [Nonomuraea antri]NRQ39664.1 right-handed parallel beta-helix repeat-containing protein [Nonomuraea antri]
MRLYRRLAALAATAVATTGLVAFPAEAAPARNFFVDCQAADGGSGRTAAEPLNSLAAVNAIALRPKDKIKFRAGTVCAGRLEPVGSGSAEHPVVFTSYGEGPKPIIQGDGGEWAVHLVDNSHLTMEKLHITNPAATTAKRTGIQYNSTTLAPKAGLVLRELEISDVAGWGNKTGANGSWFSYSAGISIQALPEGKVGYIDGVTITDNYVHDTGGGGIKISRKGTDYHKNVYIARNTIRAVGGDGIVVHASDKPLIEHNLFDEGGAGKYPYVDGNFAGMWPINSVDPVFQYNEVTRQRPTIFDSTAWDCDGGIKGTCVYQYNYSHDNAGGFYLGCQSCTEFPNYKATAILRFNIAQDDCRIAGNASGDNKSPLWLYNNTFFCASEKLNIAVPTGDSKIANNIFYAHAGTLPTAPGIRYDSNVYYGGIAAHPSDATAVTADPGLAAPGTATGFADADGYKLVKGSPAFATGAVVDGLGGTDYFGNPVAGTVSRGAYNGPAVDPVVYESVAEAYNNVAVSSDHNPNTGGFSTSGRSYSGQGLAAAGLVPGETVDVLGADFVWHPRPYGSVDNVKAAGQTIKLAGQGSKLVFLGAGAFKVREAVFKVTYTDGTVEDKTVKFGDQWDAAAPAGAVLVARAAYHNRTQTSYKNPATGQTRESGVSVFGYAAPLDPAKTVATVTFPQGSPLANEGFHVFDLKIAS